MDSFEVDVTLLKYNASKMLVTKPRVIQPNTYKCNSTKTIFQYVRHQKLHIRMYEHTFYIIILFAQYFVLIALKNKNIIIYSCTIIHIRTLI